MSTKGKNVGLQDTHKYDDIINLPHHVSSKHPRMDMIARAAQFSPFAALTGHEDAIDETARLTDKRIELDESMRVALDEKLQLIMENIKNYPEITITYFIPDEKKSGGAYIDVTGSVRRIDLYENVIVFLNDRKVPIKDVIDLNGKLFREL